MNKSLINKILLLAVVLFTVSCSEDEVDVSTSNSITMELTGVDADATYGETSRVVTVNFSFDEAQIVDTEVSVALDPVKTTATNGEDFSFEPVTVEVPAYKGSGSFTYEIFEDLCPEENETISFILTGVLDPFGASNSLTHNATIRDSVHSSLQLAFDWEGTFLYQGGTYTLCPNVDLDIYVLNEAMEGLGIYDAATGACPEHLTIQGGSANWPDGKYLLASSMWENGLAGLGLDVDYPIRVSIDKGGVYCGEVYVPTEFWNSEEEDYANGGNGSLKPVLEVTVEGTKYTIAAPGGDIIVSGFGPANNPFK